MRKISRVFQIKEGRSWKETYRTEDQAEIYKSLAQELMNSKIFHSSYYKRMEQHNNYDGTRTITFYQDNGKSVYIIEAR